jgi:hypothetical protein
MLEACLINARLAEQYVPEWALYGLTVSFQVFESAYTAPLASIFRESRGEESGRQIRVSLEG